MECAESDRARDVVIKNSYGADKALKGVMSYLKSLEERNNQLLSKLNDFKKDDEIKNLENKLEHNSKYSVHVFTEKEHREFKEFQNKHYKECGNGSPTIVIKGTGIGNHVIVRCDACGDIENITDFEVW